MGKRRRRAVFFVLYWCVWPSFATAPFYHEGALFGKKEHLTMLDTRWLNDANTSLGNAIKTCNIKESTCRDVSMENDMKTLIQATHDKTNTLTRDPDILALQNQANATTLPPTLPGVGYCDSTDCVYSNATPQEANSLVPLKDYLALSHVTHDFNGAHVLTGELSHCRDTLGSYSQCCGVAHGWGQDVHLTHCSADEKTLSQQRAKGLCLLAGSRCHEKVLGQCLLHEKFYCCYGSALLREVREGGIQQLHLGFGSPHHPDCRGITIFELQRLDFTKLTLTTDIKPPTAPMSDMLSLRLNTHEVMR